MIIYIVGGVWVGCAGGVGERGRSTSVRQSGHDRQATGSGNDHDTTRGEEDIHKSIIIIHSGNV